LATTTAGSGSTPPRKCRCGGEDEWLATEAAKRSHARAAVWGVRLRGHFNTFLLLLLVLLAFLAVSVGTRSGNGGAPQEPSTLSVTTGKGNGTEPLAPVSPSAMTKKEISVAPHTPTRSPVTKKKGNRIEPQTSAKKALPVSITMGNGAEPRALRTVPSRSDDAAGFGSGDQQQAECDMSSGRWVYDGTAYPLYKESACTFMSNQSACQKFGRTDLRYQHWRWQPHGCDLPRYVRRSSFTCLCFHACRTTRNYLSNCGHERSTFAL
jgi:hypothetical protein